MEGSESKATVLEGMIKNLKKGFGGDYGVKMNLISSTYSVRSNGPLWE